MSEGTAQAAYPPADPVADAAAAFRALREPDTQPRAPNGQFATSAPPVEEAPAEMEDIDAAPQEAVETDGEDVPVEEAAEEAQLPAVELPPSWSKEQAELWTQLPAETQAYIAERDAEQNRAVNAKFQEAANARKANETALAEANANRNAYAEAIQEVLGWVAPQEPDPRHYGAGTGNYNREAYDLAVLSYRQQTQTLASLKQQRDAILAQQHEEATQASRAHYAEIERTARPAFFAAVPDMADPAKADEALGSIVRYAVSQGIPESVFRDNAENITSAELLLAWKAQQYDKLQEAKTRVTPKAKTAAPPVRPGVATPRATQANIAVQKDMKRLEQSGSVEDGAAVFKHFRQRN